MLHALISWSINILLTASVFVILGILSRVAFELVKFGWKLLDF